MEAHDSSSSSGHGEEAARGFDMTWVTSDLAMEVSAVAMVFACVVSAYDVVQHIRYYEHPRIQRGAVRILLMIPIYAVFSFLSMQLPHHRFAFDTVRDTYESFVLYQFLQLLVAYCGGEARLIWALQEKRHKGIHPAPMCCIPLFPLDRAFFVRCKRMVLQYAILKPIMSFTALIGDAAGVYHEADFRPTSLYLWVFIVNNVSITYSLWYLVVFHNETERELHYCKPVAKFICIKSIIFFAYWQGAVMALLIGAGLVFTGDDEETKERVNGTLQDFFIVVQLIPICLLHHFAFGVEKLKEEMADEPIYMADDARRRRANAVSRIDDALNLRDVVHDAMNTIFVVEGRLMEAEGEEEMDHTNAGVVGGGAIAAQCSRMDQQLDHDEDDDDDEDDDSSVATDDAEDYADNEGIVAPARQFLAAALQRVWFDDSAAAAPFCVVCGRTDRKLVERKSGHKCAECVGMKSVYMNA